MNFVAAVLAAGSATRFGGDKLSALFGGEPLLFHAIRAARAAPVGRVIVVARPGLETGAWGGDPPVEVLRVASNALSASLKAAFGAAQGSDGVFVFLGDMPCVPHTAAGRLAQMIGGHDAALLSNGGRQGHPVLLSASLFEDISKLGGDEGAGRLLRGRDSVVIAECEDPGILLDVDRPADLARLTARTRSEER